MAIAGWYWHAHQLGQTSGLSFGFWGSGADRSSISLLLDLNGWINLLLREACGSWHWWECRCC